MRLQNLSYSDNTNNRLILARHVGWDIRSSCFTRYLVKQWPAISGTMAVQIVLEVQIALMTDLSADPSISLQQTVSDFKTGDWSPCYLWVVNDCNLLPLNYNFHKIWGFLSQSIKTTHWAGNIVYILGKQTFVQLRPPLINKIGPPAHPSLDTFKPV